MSEQQHSGFGQFIPGFDFLQNLAKGASASMPQMPNLSSWIAPTLNLEELEKRIGELKAVQFWVEQNRTALAATIQALEVQKMTLATLKGMNFNMADLAAAMQAKPGPAAASGKAPEQDKSSKRSQSGAGESGDGSAGADAKVVDPLQWWGALTQQFQQIAATAMQEVAASADGAKSAAGASASGRPTRSAPNRGAAGAAKPKRPARKTTAG